MSTYAMHLEETTDNVRLPWYVWLFAWLSISLTGGLFGALFMVLQGGRFPAAGAGFAMGFYLSALVGAFVVPMFGLFARLRGLRGHKSLRLMTMAGAATGLVSGLILGPLCVVTCLLGAVGSALPGKWRLSRTQF